MNTSHQHGGAPEVFLKNANAPQRRHRYSNQPIPESWACRKPRPLHEWFEMKDVHTWGVVHAERRILELQENDEDITVWLGIRDYHQRRADTIAPKCARLFNQWNGCGVWQ